VALRRRIGLHFDDGKLGTLGEVLQRRVAERGQPLGVYLTNLEDGQTWRDEVGALARELTVGETYFFRNIDQFHAMRQLVLPARALARTSDRRIRILSAGCASGEEAYSLAIVARELPEVAGYQISIRGLDVNPAALERAASARYSPWALRETPKETHARYFRADGRDLLLDPEIRAAVTFEARNLSQPDAAFWEPGSFDVIFCRNVLMYFAPEAARAVIARFARSLVPGGYLFLGYAETLRGLSQDFHLRHTHETFYYQRRADGASAGDGEGGISWIGGETQARAEMQPAGNVAACAGADAGAWVQNIQRASERIRSLTALAPGGADPPPTTAPLTANGGGRRGPGFDLGSAVDLMRQERFSEARSALETLPPESGRDPDVLLLKAVLLTHGGDLAAAERLCGEVLVLDEMSAGAHYLTALCRERAGDSGGAASHDHVASYLDPSFAMPRLHLGLLARRAGDQKAARRELGEALTLLEREDPSRLLLFGGGFGRQGLLTLCRAELSACGLPR
jgi:chemotaxis protein methyltransferase CheR